jgi:hypothetical protein
MNHPLAIAALTSSLFAAGASAVGADVIARLEPGAHVPPMSLLSTDTSNVFPFATIAVRGTMFYVTEGDVLYGITISEIDDNTVSLSDGRTLHKAIAAR